VLRLQHHPGVMDTITSLRDCHRQRALPVALLAGAALLAAARPAGAVGTAAGLQISNQATASYRVGGSDLTVSSNQTLTLVAERLELELTWQDASDLPVLPGESGRMLSFRLSNVGNGEDAYGLSADGTLAGDDFDPENLALYLDANGNGVYEAGLDPAYLPGVNDPLLPADGSLIVFLAGDIPAAVLEGETGFAALAAVSLAGTGAPGTVLAGAGEGGADAVIGNAGGMAGDQGTYVVVTVVLGIVKTLIIADPFGGNEPIPGATITYTLSATAGGSGTALDVVISDPVPAYTGYLAGSLALDGVPLSDALDADAGDVGGTTAGLVTVRLGDLPAGTPARSISFTVEIH